MIYLQAGKVQILKRANRSSLFSESLMRLNVSHCPAASAFNAARMTAFISLHRTTVIDSACNEKQARNEVLLHKSHMAQCYTDHDIL